jgi:hypothetical protein
VLRRSGWRSREDLAGSLPRSAYVADEQTLDDVRWIRSYVLTVDATSDHERWARDIEESQGHLSNPRGGPAAYRAVYSSPARAFCAAA